MRICNILLPPFISRINPNYEWPTLTQDLTHLLRPRGFTTFDYAYLLARLHILIYAYN